MNARQTYPELQQRIENLGARIEALRSRMKTEAEEAKVADSLRLLDLETRHTELTEQLAELGRGGFGLLQRVKDELAVMEDDFTAMFNRIVMSPVGEKQEPST